jgi:hypothetical protein
LKEDTMRAVVVYESMYGNTRSIAEAIAAQLDAPAVPVKDATSELLTAAELVVIGSPTHAWGMPRASTRKAAIEGAAKPGSELTVEPGAAGIGIREWLAEHGNEIRTAAVFDTRIKAPGLVTGRASRHIARELRRCGAVLVASPHSFLVTKANRLVPGEQERAHVWAKTLARSVVAR